MQQIGKTRSERQSPWHYVSGLLVLGLGYLAVVFALAMVVHAPDETPAPRTVLSSAGENAITTGRTADASRAATPGPAATDPTANDTASNNMASNNMASDALNQTGVALLERNR
ncbi:MAG: hypothetical protein ACFCVE_13965 [Phycisphaerae bacterium]